MDGPAWMGDEDLRHFLEASRASNYTCNEITSLLSKKFPNYRAYSERTVKRYNADNEHCKMMKIVFNVEFVHYCMCAHCS